jgi:hypothetical protein
MSHARLEVRMESLSPFLWGSCIPYNMPVYPGAQCKIANALNERYALKASVDNYKFISPTWRLERSRWRGGHRLGSGAASSGG